MDGGTDEFRRQWIDPGDRPTVDRPAGSAPGGTPVAVPLRIDRYSIKRLIGSGGMGVVYEAVQDFPRRSVALKVLASGPDGPDPVTVQRFLDESQFLAAMKHPGICQIYDAGTYSPDQERTRVFPYLVMELVDGGLSLTTFARTLGLRERVELLKRVAEAVQHGHSRGVIHRDLKPDNVLVDASGQSKVIDFGIAKAIGAEALAAGRTLDGQVVGTLQYMSPEQLAGSQSAVDVRTDVYALGVMLYELVCGQLPYHLGSADVMTARRIVSGTIPPRPSSVARDIDPDLEAVIERAMQKEPERRYASAGEMERDLSRWLAGDRVTTRRATGAGHAMQRLRFLVGRHIVWAGAGIVAAAAAATYLIVPPMLDESRAKDLLASWVGGVGHRFAGTASTLRGVVVVGPRTTPELEDFLAARGVTVPAELAQNHSKLAPEIAAAGEAVKLLASAHPGAIAIDYGRAIAKHPEFSASARAACESGVPVVCAVWPWPAPSDDPLGELRGVPGLHVGGISLGEPETEGADQWSADLVLEQGYRATWPGISLAAYAASRHPKLFPSYTLLRELNEVEIRYMSSADGSARAAAPPDRVRLTEIDGGEDSPEANVSPDDTAGKIYFTVPEDAELARATIGLSELLELANNGGLAGRLGGRIVLVGDMRTDIDYKDTGEYAGREIARVFAHAAAVSTIASPSSTIHFQSEWGWLLASASGAAFGVIAGWRRRPWVLLGVLLASGALCALVGSVILFTSTRTVMSPLLPMAGMLLAGVLAWTVMPRSVRAGR